MAQFEPEILALTNRIHWHKSNRISQDESLQLRVVTFTNVKAKDRLSFKKRRFEEYPQYTYVPATQTLRRKGEEVSGEAFIQKQFKNTKSNIDFLDISSLNQFQASKSGLAQHFLKLVDEKLGSYLSLTLKELEVKEVKKFEGGSYSGSDGFSSFLRENEFTLIDLIDTPVSEHASNDFLQVVKESYGVSVKKAAKVNKRKINFVLIHNKEYFKDFPEEDHYQEFQNSDAIIQHTTYEDLFLSSDKLFKLRKSDAKNAVINVLLKEACIKHDLKQKQISLIDWQKFGYNRDWTFGLRVDEKVYFLTVSPEGGLAFRTLYAFGSLFDSSEYQLFVDLMLDSANGEENNAIQGFVKNEHGEINLIERTGLFTLPNITSLHASLEKEELPVSFTQPELLDLLNSFKSLVVKYQEPLISIIRQVEEQNQDTFSREDIVRLLANKSLLKEFSFYVFDKTGQVLRNYFRDAQQKYELISAQLSVNYAEVVPETEALYFVGTKDKNVNLKFARSAVIRKVKAPEGHKLFFQQLLPLMNVDFVKNEDLTVLPFPFKYLREYIELEKKKAFL